MEQGAARIIQTERLAPDITRLTLHRPTLASQARPGQFVTIKPAHGSDPLLRRPFSIHNVCPEDGDLQIVFKILGQGTRNLASLAVGETVDLLGPLGNHFRPSPLPTCLVGGGLGIAPLLFLARQLRAEHGDQELLVILGARHAQELLALSADFASLGITPHLATDDGSLGHHGLVTDLLATVLPQKDKWQIHCCGPYPMMRAVAAICRERRWPCQVSLETMMACGISACLGCAVAPSPARGGNGHYLHVCKDGPVFEEGDIQWKP